jgi:ribosomal protein S18 acetylase RimI-like enzyme
VRLFAASSNEGPIMAGASRPVVTLRPMTDVEFRAWREVAIRHHADQVSRATGKDVDVATKESRELLAKVLAGGLATERMNLFVVVDDSEREVGWLWLGTSPQDSDAGFVFDIIVDPNVRGRGYGRATMRAAEQFFQAQGKSGISLDVAGGNDAARGLYESLGYRPVMTSMTKRFDQPHSAAQSADHGDIRSST